MPPEWLVCNVREEVIGSKRVAYPPSRQQVARKGQTESANCIHDPDPAGQQLAAAVFHGEQLATGIRGAKDGTLRGRAARYRRLAIQQRRVGDGRRVGHKLLLLGSDER